MEWTCQGQRHGRCPQGNLSAPAYNSRHHIWTEQLCRNQCFPWIQIFFRASSVQETRVRLRTPFTHRRPQIEGRSFRGGQDSLCAHSRRPLVSAGVKATDVCTEQTSHHFVWGFSLCFLSFLQCWVKAADHVCKLARNKRIFFRTAVSIQWVDSLGLKNLNSSIFILMTCRLDKDALYYFVVRGKTAFRSITLDESFREWWFFFLNSFY